MDGSAKPPSQPPCARIKVIINSKCHSGSMSPTSKRWGFRCWPMPSRPHWMRKFNIAIPFVYQISKTNDWTAQNWRQAYVDQPTISICTFSIVHVHHPRRIIANEYIFIFVGGHALPFLPSRTSIGIMFSETGEGVDDGDTAADDETVTETSPDDIEMADLR